LVLASIYKIEGRRIDDAFGANPFHIEFHGGPISNIQVGMRNRGDFLARQNLMQVFCQLAAGAKE
jgi:hypothetical protein